MFVWATLQIYGQSLGGSIKLEYSMLLMSLPSSGHLHFCNPNLVPLTNIKQAGKQRAIYFHSGAKKIW